MNKLIHIFRFRWLKPTAIDSNSLWNQLPSALADGSFVDEGNCHKPFPKNRFQSILSALTLALFLPLVLPANNLRISNLATDGNEISFDIAWDNAWNLSQSPANHDAVWLFAKIRYLNDPWQHLHFATDSSAFVVSPEGNIHFIPAPLGEGLMLKSLIMGDMPTQTIHLRLAEPLSGQDFLLQVFGIEMVYVPEGPFWVGDGGSNFCLRDSSTGQPYFVGTEAEIGANVLTANGPNVPEGIIPAQYPKGYGGFYLMKHELSQAQYADFLNTLTYTQQTVHTANSPSSPTGTLALMSNAVNRSAIVVVRSGHAPSVPAYYGCDLEEGISPNGDSDGLYRACNGLTWQDLAAYLDWAALRPMTELEFEKACRGPLAPIPLEFAWGTDSVVDANTPQYDGSWVETVAEAATPNAGLASHGYAGPQGPLRGGFGANAISGRLQAGAGYYGNLELSGNLWEYVVSTKVAGLAFDGRCGDGSISDGGTADVPTWPILEGAGFKGGAWNSGVIPGFRDLAVSDRFYIGHATDIRRATAGGRGAR